MQGVSPHSRRRFLAAVGTAALAGCAVTDGLGIGGPDWPETAEGTTEPLPDESADWPQFGRDPGHSAFAPEVRVDDPTEDWTFELTGGMAPPAVVGDHVFVYGSTATESGYEQGECVIDSLRTTDGGREWRRPLPGFGDAISGCPPIVYRGSVYVGTASQSGLFALNARDGSPRWSHETGDSINEAAVGVGDRVIASTGDELLAFDLQGREQWTYRTGDDRSSFAPPATGNGYILYATSGIGSVVAIPPGSGGSVSEWRYVRDASFGTPTVANGTAYIPDRSRDSGRIHAIDSATGTRRWATDVALSSGPVTDGERLYVATDAGELVAYSVEDGREQWRTQVTGDDERLDTRPLVTSRSVVVTGDKPQSDRRARTYAVDRRTGESRWSVDQPGNRALGGAVAAGGRIYVPLYWNTDDNTKTLAVISD